MSEFKYIETNRVSKAQKRRNAKAAKKNEQLKRIEECEKLDEHKERRIEQEKLIKILGDRHLKIYDIEADGDCLFKAVEHQLGLAGDSIERLTCREIREKTGRYMLDNAGNFMPFLLDQNGDLMSLNDFQNYCDRMTTTKEWGGHLELTAISQFTQKPIHIYQAENKTPLVIESHIKSGKEPILLSFHKHLYHLGEHYNSLVPDTS